MTTPIEEFIAKKAEIDSMLVRFQSLSDDHFNVAPENITWAHVCDMGRYTKLLKEINDRIILDKWS